MGFKGVLRGYLGGNTGILRGCQRSIKGLSQRGVKDDQRGINGVLMWLYWGLTGVERGYLRSFSGVIRG